MSTDYAVIIPLTQGQSTMVSPDDADLAGLSWYADKRKNGYYARRGIRGGKKTTQVYLHKVIIERILGRPLNKGELVDHENGNPLDNTRENLRLSTRPQNQQNMRLHKDNKSGYKGVSFHRPTGKWRAEIMANGQKRFLGYHDDVLIAAEAYRLAAIELHGEFARQK